jgi:hypothetical protein
MMDKTKYLSVFAGLVVLGLAAVGIRHREAPPPNPTIEPSETKQASPLPSNTSTIVAPSPGFATVSPQDIVDPRDWVANGPKEPLVPREIHVKAELAPGSVLTAEPLTPKELHVDAELAPGETMTAAPLTPREIRAGDPSR